MWTINRLPTESDWLNLEVVETLYEFDGPKIFTCRDEPGNTYLAYQCDEDSLVMRLLVVPTNDVVVRQLNAGEISVRDALTRTPAWLFDVGKNWMVFQCWSVAIDEIPPRKLPKPGVMLLPDHEPVKNRVAAVGSPFRDVGTTTATGSSIQSAD